MKPLKPLNYSVCISFIQWLKPLVNIANRFNGL